RAVAGRMRVAETWEAAALIPWMEGFEEDTGIFSTGAADTLRRLVEARALFVWEVEDAPVSMAGVSGNTPNGVRVGYVYTPPEHRGRGYAGALTAALSQFLLDEGRRFCFLYTNLADPVSNGIYRRLGYELVANATAYRFDAA
ncbi:MAG TPA: GNAT family N-acetyltransferase, partial [Longimicrobiales bacterium]|nr:GNAT family N-acetyltransferase [Longimicrobiales bacterium]